MRHVSSRPPADFFKPVGVPCHALEVVTLTLDEVEALRLADLEGLYQEQASAQMKISRQTFARIIEEARKKTADALIHGKALRLEGGTVTVKGAAVTPGRDGTESPRSQSPCGCERRRGCALKNAEFGKDAKAIS